MMRRRGGVFSSGPRVAAARPLFMHRSTHHKALQFLLKNLTLKKERVIMLRRPAGEDEPAKKMRNDEGKKVAAPAQSLLMNGTATFMKPKTDVNQFSAIRAYIQKNGFGEKTPALTKSLNADVFRQHYYDKNTLLDFCNLHGISPVGLKNELNDRIDLFLRKGIVTRKQPVKKSDKWDSESGLHLDLTVVNYKSDDKTREFFAKHIKDFKFSAYIQKWLKERLKNGETFTYGDVIEEQKRFQKEKSAAKSAGKPLKVAHDSCQMNQFYSDYSQEPAAQPHTRQEAWELVRDTAGDKTFARYKLQIQEIIQKINAEHSLEKMASV